MDETSISVEEVLKALNARIIIANGKIDTEPDLAKEILGRLISILPEHEQRHIDAAIYDLKVNR